MEDRQGVVEGPDRRASRRHRHLGLAGSRRRPHLHRRQDRRHARVCRRSEISAPGHESPRQRRNECLARHSPRRDLHPNTQASLVYRRANDEMMEKDSAMRIVITFAALVLAPSVPVRADNVTVTEIRAVHRHGQTFVTWKDLAEREAGAKYRYSLYRSDRPITAANVAQAELCYRGVLNNSARLYG